MRFDGTYLGPLGLASMGLLAASGAANVTKAVSFAPAEPTLAGLPIYQILAALIAVAVVVAVWRLPKLSVGLRAAGEAGAATLASLLLLLSALVDAGLSYMAMADARAAVLAQHGALDAQRELARVDDQAEEARRVRAVMTAPALVSDNDREREFAVRAIQRECGILADGVFGGDTQGCVSDRLNALAAERATLRIRRDELRGVIAAAERDTVPLWVLLMLAIGVDGYLLIAFSAIARARRQNALVGGSGDRPAAANDMVAVAAYVRDGRPVRAHTRSPRGGGRRSASPRQSAV